MSGVNSDIIGGTVIGLALGFFALAIPLGCIVESKWQQMAVEKGFAEYNNSTGDWQWKEESK